MGRMLSQELNHESDNIVGLIKIGIMWGRKGKAGICQRLRGILSRLDRKQRVREQRTKLPRRAKARLHTLRQSAKQLGEQLRNEQTTD